MRRRSPVAIIILAFIALVVFGYANNAAYFTSHADTQEDQQKTDSSSKSKSSSSSQSTSNSTDACSLPEMTIGNPATATARITYGYTADENVERDPCSISKIADNLKQAEQAIPGSSLQIVCLDIPTDQRADPNTANVPQGFALNGSLVPELNSASKGTPIPPQGIATILQGHLRSAMHAKTPNS